MFEDGKIPLIRTPIPLLQLITAGGIRFSTLVELWGANKAGKTTTCYQSGGYFLDDYGDKALLKILDSESSCDHVRMKESFGLDLIFDKRIEVKPAHFLEDGFLKIMEWIQTIPKDHYMIIIWDTISASPTKSAYEAVLHQNDAEEEEEKPAKKGAKKGGKKKDASNMFLGGMGDRQRIIKYFLRVVMSEIYGKNISLWMPNQVFSNIGKGPALMRGEGTALQHDIHYSLKFNRLQVKIEETEKLADSTISHVSLVKSKFSPEFEKCPIFMDNTQGGRIIESESTFLLAVEMGLIQEAQGYYRIDPNAKGRRWSSIIEDAELYNKVLFTMVDRMRRKYPIVDKLYVLNGHSELEILEEPKKKKSSPALSCNLTQALKDVESESRESLLIVPQKKKSKSVVISDSTGESETNEVNGDESD
jgi:RecA/RadA recombinase